MAEEINDKNREAILNTIEQLKEKETKIRILRQNLESKYFYYVNKNHIYTIMSKETEK